MRLQREIGRRELILGAAGTRLLGGASEPADPKAGLRLLVISDAHFGWDGGDQPSDETIGRALRQMIERLSPLDAVVDTGDATHSLPTDDHRARWISTIADGCGTLPFFYLIGNHEQNADGDSEAQGARMGSLPHRPYYSVTLHGVHLVFVPQLMQVSWLGEEVRSWLELDLGQHRSLTTLLFGHNSIRGTTESGSDTGYRQLMNSGYVLELMARFPQIRAWLHGHNHTFEVVPRDGRLFVSNGRIGGFDPGGPRGCGSGHLGGVLVSIGTEQVEVRPYSATAGRFFDELSRSAQNLRQTLVGRTTLVVGECSASFGEGQFGGGRRVAVFQHLLPDQSHGATLTTKPEAAALNENHDLGSYTARRDGSGSAKLHLLPGYQLRAGGSGTYDENWRWQAGEVTIKAAGSRAKSWLLSVPGGGHLARRYYRCAPGLPIRLELVARTSKGSAPCRPVALFTSASGLLQRLVGPTWTIEEGGQTLVWEFAAPTEAPEGTIYRQPVLDGQLQLEVVLEGECPHPQITLRTVLLTTPGTAPAGWTVNETVVGMGSGTVELGGLRSRNVLELRGLGGTPHTWHLQQRRVAWQIRGAPGEWKEDQLQIGPYRAGFSAGTRVVVAPVGHRPSTFLSALVGIDRARITPVPRDGRVTIAVLAMTQGSAWIELTSATGPDVVSGSKGWTYESGLLKLPVSGPGSVQVEFGMRNALDCVG